MTEFYYQIKGKEPNSLYPKSDEEHWSWKWPPLFSGKVEAEDKKQAKALIEDEYGRKFPQRVFKKDMAEHAYLINIREIKENDDSTRALFEEKDCKHCSSTFRRIDLYNDCNESYKGTEYCSSECCKADYDQQKSEYDLGLIVSPNAKAVIYQILNIETGKCYVGKTTQVFTLRWYQHFYHGSGTKFHQTIKNSKLEDWAFSILETVEIPKGASLEERSEVIARREQWWINEKNSISDGYNTATAQKDEAA